MPLDQLLRAQPSPTRQRAQLSDSYAVTGDVIDLPRLHRIHDRGGVVAELALGDDLHVTSVAPCSSTGYTSVCLDRECDTLFPDGVGKTTSPENFTSLFSDVKSRIFDQLPDDTWFYPGHGDDSTLGKERPNLDEWRARGW